MTRPARQALKLSQLIESEQGIAVNFPVLELLPMGDYRGIANTFAQLKGDELVFFVSANAVNFACDAIGGKLTIADTIAIFSVGKATREALLQAGCQVDFVPEIGFNSEALLEMPELQNLYGRKCLIVRGSHGRELLADTLRARGADVEYLQVYKREIPACDCRPVIDLIRQGQLDAITITSVESLKNLMLILGDSMRQQLLLIPLVVLSERILKKAREFGFKTILKAEEPSDLGIIKALKNGVKSG